MGVFKFKEFSVCDDRATMKVGTDGVLLGAWASINKAKFILDIGTGSGVIALMLAQRSVADARIHAIELQAEDAQQASENFLDSPWPEKISAIHSSLQDFIPVTKYDLIVCNPPFFSKSLLPPAATRSKVRHDTSLTSEELLTAVVRLLSPAGKFCVILPAAKSEIFIQKAISKKIVLHRLTRFFTRHGKPQKRSIMEFTLAPGPILEDSLILHQSANRWTDEYWRLTQEFYIERHV